MSERTNLRESLQYCCFCFFVHYSNIAGKPAAINLSEIYGPAHASAWTRAVSSISLLYSRRGRFYPISWFTILQDRTGQEIMMIWYRISLDRRVFVALLVPSAKIRQEKRYGGARNGNRSV